VRDGAVLWGTNELWNGACCQQLVHMRSGCCQYATRTLCYAAALKLVWRAQVQQLEVHLRVLRQETGQQCRSESPERLWPSEPGVNASLCHQLLQLTHVEAAERVESRKDVA
jgi:hypothetical protein